MKAFQIQSKKGQYQTLDEESDYPLDAPSNEESPNFDQDQKIKKKDLAVRVALLFFVIAFVIFGTLTVRSHYL